MTQQHALCMFCRKLIVYCFPPQQCQSSTMHLALIFVTTSTELFSRNMAVLICPRLFIIASTLPTSCLAALISTR